MDSVAGLVLSSLLRSGLSQKVGGGGRGEGEGSVEP